MTGPTDRSLRAFLHDEGGATLAEYAIILSSLTILGVLAMQAIGGTANSAVAHNEQNLTNTALVAP